MELRKVQIYSGIGNALIYTQVIFKRLFATALHIRKPPPMH